MSTQIDVYTYPKNASAKELAKYNAAVMTAWAEGATVEVNVPHGTQNYWEVCTGDPAFNFLHFCYRVARPQETDDQAIERIWRKFGYPVIPEPVPQDVVYFGRALLAWEREKGNKS